MPLRAYDTEQFCYLTTTGRITGRPHEIEIWFAFPPDPTSATLYLMSGGRDRSDWVKNLLHNPRVAVRFADSTWTGTARVIPPHTDEDTLTRHLLCAKYQNWHPGQPLSDWGQTALPIAITLDQEATP
ncbi:MAG: nitroreductase family deazaflavin-dependent oxidoreductase [Chloroflexia bacterium]